MIRLNILEQRKNCGCGGNCKCGTKKKTTKNKSMEQFFSAMKSNTEEFIK